MALRYKEFCGNDFKRYPSGIMAGETLSLKKGFNRKQVSQDSKRLLQLKKMLSQSKTGQQTLEFLEQKGTKIYFENMKNAYGFFDPEKNIIALNSRCSDEDLAVTFVHETRHAWQDSQMDTTSFEMTPKAFFVSGFAIEADACAAEVMYAHEMREKNPKIWEAHQRSGYAPMSTAFEKTFQKTGDAGQARADALAAWYTLRTKDSYGDTYVEWLSMTANQLVKQKEREPEVFSEDRASRLIVDTLFKDYDGKKFLKDTSVVEKKENLCINEKQARALVRALHPYMGKYHRTSEQLGLDKIAVYKDGSYTNCAAYVTELRNACKTKAVVAQKNGNSR